MLRQVDPRAVGALLAQLAVPPEAGPVDWGHDSSTAFWIDRYREQGGAGAAAGRTA
ncbi:glucose-6-phosphate isomerase [Bordetella pertussis]|nr:glucose-6-phosphate isomerase [Bordetella pertussis]